VNKKVLVKSPELDPWKNVFYSILLPGLPHFIAGKMFRGIVFFISFPTFFLMLVYWARLPGAGGLSLVFLLMNTFLISVYFFRDAYRLPLHQTIDLNTAGPEGVDKQGKSFWLACFLDSFFPGLGLFYFKWYLPFLFSIPALICLVSLYLLVGNAYFDIADSIFRSTFAFAIIVFFSSDRPKLKKWIWILILFAINASVLVSSVPTFIRNHVLMTAISTKGSMLSTIGVDDRCIIVRQTEAFNRFDVVGFRRSEKNVYLIGRIVGLPGETIAYKNGVLIVNGKEIAEPDVIATEALEKKPVRLGSRDYFVMDDNRLFQWDLSYSNVVLGDAIYGLVVKKYWPFPIKEIR